MRTDYSGFIAGDPINDGQCVRLGGIESSSEDEEAGCFLPERTDSTAGPGAVIARSGNGAVENRVPPQFFLKRYKQPFFFLGNMGQELVRIRQSCYRRSSHSSDERFKCPGPHTALPAQRAPQSGVSFTL